MFDIRYLLFEVSFPIRLAVFLARGRACMKLQKVKKRTAEPQNIGCLRVDSLSHLIMKLTEFILSTFDIHYSIFAFKSFIFDQTGRSSCQRSR
ncbi:hypothetical protein D1AOALGA4SA_1690 [Olavius algarvensis Delta 1 endosymbiont]|nr:hypothetical protein D1AOALGA4SA_1690 [Olavius algarvensis Delta 1 endosymbiont]